MDSSRNRLVSTAYFARASSVFCMHGSLRLTVPRQSVLTAKCHTAKFPTVKNPVLMKKNYSRHKRDAFHLKTILHRKKKRKTRKNVLQISHQVRNLVVYIIGLYIHVYIYILCISSPKSSCIYARLIYTCIYIYVCMYIS